MGGSTRIPLVDWRGCLVSKDLVDPLDDLAASVRPKVTPIPGYGSYRDNDASGGTDNGSGHVDIYAGDGWTDADRKAFEAGGRQRGLMAFYRPKTLWSPVRQKTLTFTWARHFHVIRKDSDDLSDGALKQLREWYAGSNGLAGFWWNGVFRHDPDTGPRTFLRQTWPQYITAKEADDMDISDEVTLAQSVYTVMGKPAGSKLSVGGLLQYGAAGFFETRKYVRPQLAAQAKALGEVKGQLAGHAEILKQMQASGSVTDIDAVLAATKEAARAGAAEGAAAALDDIIDDADVTLQVTPPTG